MGKVKVLSLFDGMGCGYLAMLGAGVEVDRYVAYEIDKYAIKVAKHNIPIIEHRGDVFDADFTEFEGFDFLVGGSPCTHWSIAQKNNRETEASGIGWELFQQYVRALTTAHPKYFIYENNKSMSPAIRESINETFGFEATLINSGLVSAQNRNRLYWVGSRNDDGSYSKADVQQPLDLGLVVEDILDDNCLGAVPIGTPNGKSHTLKAQYAKNSALNAVIGGQTYSATMVSEPICVNSQSGDRHGLRKQPSVADCIYSVKGKNPIVTASYQTNIAEPLRVGDLPNSQGKISGSQATRIYSIDGKSVNLVANGGGQWAKTGLYAIRTDGRKDKVYEVIDGKIEINDKFYDIKLANGFYIIRKLTVSECMRLQTVPSWYDFSCVSNTQAYKCLGNGWTVDVITHLINSALNQK